MDYGLRFSSDEPISNRRDDLFGRAKYADDIAHMLCSSSLGSSSFAVGLYGPWGSGKTSVINLVEDSIRRETNSMLVMRFEPWNYLSTAQLIEQFFDELTRLIKEKTPSGASGEVGDAISGYVKALLSSSVVLGAVNDPVLVSGVLAATYGLGLLSHFRKKKRDDELTISARKEKLIEKMSNLDMRVAVFIDDIDRLPNEQIRMIFQLITSLANLPKVNYFLSFDEDVVVRALSSVQSCDGREYLEKIIQIPLRLPNPSSAELRRLLSLEMLEVGVDCGFDVKQVDTWRWLYIKDELIAPSFSTLRQVKRYLNALRARLLLCGPSASYLDIAVLVYIEVCVSPLGSWIIANRESLWGTYGSFLHADNIQGKRKEEGFLSEFSLKFPNLDPEKLLDIVCVLFPRVAQETGKITRVFDRKGDLNGVWRPESFCMYFETNADVGIDIADVAAICNELDKDDILGLLNRYHLNHKVFRLISAIVECISDLSYERMFIVCSALLSFLGVSGDASRQGNRNVSVNELIIRSCESCFERLGVEQSEIIAKDALNAGGCRVAFCFSLELIWQLNHSYSHSHSNANGEFVQLFSESCLQELCATVCDSAENENEVGNFYHYLGSRFALSLYRHVRPQMYPSFVLKLISSDDSSFIHFISDSCTVWKSEDGRPSTFGFSVSDYEDILSLEEFRKRVDGVCSEEGFAHLNKTVQLIMVSFLMFCEDPKKNSDVQVKDAERRLRELI